MTKLKRNNMQALLFEDFGIISSRINSLKNIVQNRDMDATAEQLEEWERLFDVHLKELKLLKKAVIKFYQ